MRRSSALRNRSRARSREIGYAYRTAHDRIDRDLRAFGMASCLCRLCLVSVPSGHAVCLFSSKAEKLKLRSRIADLLDLPVIGEKDGFSKHICEKCKRKLERLEKAAEELAEFRCQAKSVLQRGHLKRTKETSSLDGVSPDTAKTRPPYKKHLLRRKLDFDQSDYSNC